MLQKFYSVFDLWTKSLTVAALLFPKCNHHQNLLFLYVFQIHLLFRLRDYHSQLWLSLLLPPHFSFSLSLFPSSVCRWLDTRKLSNSTSWLLGTTDWVLWPEKFLKGHYLCLSLWPFFSLLPWQDLIIIPSFDVFINSSRSQILSSRKPHKVTAYPFMWDIQFNFQAMVFFLL